jgi:hypothetical protein
MGKQLKKRTGYKQFPSVKYLPIISSAWRENTGQVNDFLLSQSVLRVVNPGERFLFALDDTPTKRYGPHVEGAGIHHNPTPGPAEP